MHCYPSILVNKSRYFYFDGFHVLFEKLSMHCFIKIKYVTTKIELSETLSVKSHCAIQEMFSGPWKN